ncbi:hypothetical protein JCM10213v2_009039 [Rhodosporidiobolus nylandii]
MPYHVGGKLSWFNYMKGLDFRLWSKDDSTTNDAATTWFADGTVAKGAQLGNA